MTRPGEPDATMPVPTGGEPTMPAESYPGSADPTQYGGGGGGGERFGGDGGEGDGEEEGDRRKLWMIAGGVLLFGLLVGALVAVLASGGDGDETTTTSSSSSTSSSTTSTTIPPTTTAPTSPPVQNPSIVQFTVNQNPVNCPNDNSSPNVTLNWSTQNASSVTISIDNPNGPYGTYPPSGQQSVPFACGVNPLQHTYYLVANGPGNSHSQQKQIIVNGTAPPATTTTGP